MKFTMNVDMDNAAFTANRIEMQLILDKVGEEILRDKKEGFIRDTNGNSVGTWDIS